MLFTITQTEANKGILERPHYSNRSGDRDRCFRQIIFPCFLCAADILFLPN